MTYNFDLPISRINTNSRKYDGCLDIYGTDDIIPMWLADMDFEAAHPISEAVYDRAKHPIYGYASKPQSYFASIQNWLLKRHNINVDTSLMSVSPSVITAISCIIQTHTNVGDKILIQTPVYPKFHAVIRNTKREIIVNKLIHTNDTYLIDFVDFEEKLKEGVKIFILCSPHNPVGRCWTEEELEKITNLCIKYNTLIISDEIHSDFILFGNKHTPTASISPDVAKNTVTCISTSKTFNLAGLQSGTILFSNAETKKLYDDFAESINILHMNCFVVTANEAAYKYGEEWLTEVISYIESNMVFVKNYIDKYIPNIKVTLPDATYLLWLDFTKFNLPHEKLNEILIKEAKVGLSECIPFDNDLTCFYRMNVACSRSKIEEVLENLKKAFENY